MFEQARTIGVVGLGYVGLPVAVEFSKKYPTIGFDLNRSRVEDLSKGIDRNGELSDSDLRQTQLVFTDDLKVLEKANFYIVAVPTPIDDAKQPDLKPLVLASELVGQILKQGDFVVYESTVYPGLTEEECLPILERESGLSAGKDFKVGYSPERVNPGDTEHTFAKIKKVVSGQDKEALELIAEIYGSVVTAGVHKAPSIKVAEAAKVIENTQRDLNVALMNELALIFDKAGIQTSDVLAAASTKWNFLKFTPGLVGGHCIGVDPYYLTHLAEKLNYIPQVILAGRRINDGMGTFVAQRTIKEMIRAGHSILGSTVTVLGLSFKENCRDIRNTKVVDIIKELEDYGLKIQVCDPIVLPKDAEREYKIRLLPLDDLPPADAVIAAVSHQVFLDLPVTKLKGLLKDKPVLIDVKGTYKREELEASGIRVWRL